MEELTLDAAFERSVVPQIEQFEANAALWRLEADRHSHLLFEGVALGIEDAEQRRTADVTMDGINDEIDRFQTFAKEESSPPLDMLVRLAEVAAALETARRRLARAIDLAKAAPADMAEAPP